MMMISLMTYLLDNGKLNGFSYCLDVFIIIIIIIFFFFFFFFFFCSLFINKGYYDCWLGYLFAVRVCFDDVL